MLAMASKIMDVSFLGELISLCFCLLGHPEALIWHALGSSVSLPGASKIMDFAYIGKLPNLWSSLPNQAKSLISFTLPTSQIYDFVCRGKPNNGFCLPLQSSKSLMLLARAGNSCKQNRWVCFNCQVPKSLSCVASVSKIIDFTYIGKLPDLCFCMPGQVQSLIWLTLASSQIYGFVCQGKQNHWCCLHWQAPTSCDLVCQGKQNHRFYLPWQDPKSIVLLATGTKINHWFCCHCQAPEFMILLTPASYQIYDFTCQGKQNHWVHTFLGKPPNLWFCFLGQAKSLILHTLGSSNLWLPSPGQTKTFFFRALASFQVQEFACQGEQNHGCCLHWQAPKSLFLFAGVSKIMHFAYLGKLPNLWCCLPGQAKSLILFTLASGIYGFACQGKAKS